MHRFKYIWPVTILLILYDLTRDGNPLYDLTRDGYPLYNLTRDGNPLYNLTRDGYPLYNLTRDGYPLYDLTRDGHPLNNLTRDGIPLYNLTRDGIPLYDLTRNGHRLSSLFRLNFFLIFRNNLCCCIEFWKSVYFKIVWSISLLLLYYAIFLPWAKIWIKTIVHNRQKIVFLVSFNKILIAYSSNSTDSD